jgi:hypothetical protein
VPIKFIINPLIGLWCDASWASRSPQPRHQRSYLGCAANLVAGLEAYGYRVRPTGRPPSICSNNPSSIPKPDQGPLGSVLVIDDDEEWRCPPPGCPASKAGLGDRVRKRLCRYGRVRSCPRRGNLAQAHSDRRICRRGQAHSSNTRRIAPASLISGFVTPRARPAPRASQKIVAGLDRCDDGKAGPKSVLPKAFPCLLCDCRAGIRPCCPSRLAKQNAARAASDFFRSGLMLKTPAPGAMVSDCGAPGYPVWSACGVSCRARMMATARW